jgi:hypothetical protein
MEEGWIDPAIWKAAERPDAHGAGVVVIHGGDPPATCGCGRLLRWGYIQLEGSGVDELAGDGFVAFCRCGSEHLAPL